MGVQDLQAFIEQHCSEACKPVDLIKIARNFAYSQQRKRGPQSLRLVLDAENCLDRLYGGFYSDWACGGQWNRMTTFLRNLVQACNNSNIELIVFFNGAHENQRLQEWFKGQQEERKKVSHILKHINNKATPPPKVWWLPPASLESALRMALRQLAVSVASSMDDHHQEVIEFCRENGIQGLVAHNADYAIFEPPKYFSSEHLKLTYRGNLESTEFNIDEVAKEIDLNPDRFPVLATLLGTHILPEEDLKEFHQKLFVAQGTKCDPTKYAEQKVRAVISYVRAFPSVKDTEEVGNDVFRGCVVGFEDKLQRFKQSVLYYANGTRDGFLKYKPKVHIPPTQIMPGSYSGKKENGTKNKTVTEKVKLELNTQTKKPVIKEEIKDSTEDVAVETSATDVEVGVMDDKEGSVPSQENEEKEGKEHTEDDLNADSVYTQADSGYACSGPSDFASPVKATDLQSGSTPELEDAPILEKSDKLVEQINSLSFDEKANDPNPDETFAEPDSSIVPQTSSTPKAGSSEKQTPPTTDSSGPSSTRTSPESESATAKSQQTSGPVKEKKSKKKTERASRISHEIMRVASDRHQKGLMSPWVYQLLLQGEIKVGVSLEDENNYELPLAMDLYRPIRQHIYAILFDLNKSLAEYKKQTKAGNKLTKPKVVLKEWVASRTGSAPRCDEVVAEPLDWLVPGLHRLWMGTMVEDKNRRLRAFLSCMNCDVPQNLLLNTSYVPQHLLILCCVLRYMVLYKNQRVLRNYELDAFLATAVSPLLHDVETMQDMKLPMITVRGLQLSSLFMRGVEHAIFVNDGVGAPVPWGVTCPWLFFDGKLFHFKLLKAMNNTPLVDICDGHVDQVMKMERMRQAILQGLPKDVPFAKPGLPMNMPAQYGAGAYSSYPGQPYGDPYCTQGFGGGMYQRQGGVNMRPAGSVHPPQGAVRGRGRGRGLLGRSPVDSRGGQLQIAGVVVGNWGGQGGPLSQPTGRHHGQSGPPPHVMSVGPKRGRGGVTRGAGNQHFHAEHNQYQVRNTVQIPAHQFYEGSRGHKRRGGSAPNRGRGRNDITKVTLEQRTKGQSGLGRGCTVETVEDSNVVCVSELMKEELPLPEVPIIKDTLHDPLQFEDASVPLQLSVDVTANGISNGMTPDLEMLASAIPQASAALDVVE